MEQWEVMAKAMDQILGASPLRQKPRFDQIPWETDLHVKTVDDGSLFDGLDLEIVYKHRREAMDEMPKVKIVSVTLVSVDRIEIPVGNFRRSELSYLEDEISEKLDEQDALELREKRYER